jgi:hypothetical protein
VAHIVIEVPAGNKALAAAISALADQVAHLVGHGAGGKAIDYAQVERSVGEGVVAIECAAHQAILSSLDVAAPCIWIDDASWTRVGRYDASYDTMAGSVVVERSVYRRDGERNGKVVDPVSLRAGVVAEVWLPQPARAMAHPAGVRRSPGSRRSRGRSPARR